MFVKCSNGVVNLDQVIRIEPQSDGTAFFVFSTGSGTDYAIVDFGSTLGDATTGAERLTNPVDPASLV
jgi:hypothetical protein